MKNALLLCLMLAAPVALAEEAAAPPAPVLAKFAGAWKGTGKFTTEGKTHDLSWKMTCTAAAAGYASECRLQMTGVPGVPSYEGTSVLGVDPASGMVHWYWVTNGGEVHDHTGPLAAGDTLDLPARDGSRVVESLNITVSGKTMKFRSATMGAKGEEVALMTCEGKK